MVTPFMKCLPLRFQAEAIGVNIASFRELLFAFLLLNVLSDIQAGDNCLSCPEHNTAELGKDITIECNNNAPILFMAMKFCPLKGDHCFSKGVIYQHNNTLTYGETTLKFHSNTASLSINQTKLSHEGNYTLCYIAENSMKNLNISLEVFALYTRRQIMEQENTLICTASGGYPEEKLYWVSKTGINLTHKSTSQSVKNEDGSFNLSNTLQVESAPSDMEYCCIFNRTRVPRRQTVSECTTLENYTYDTSKIITEETTLNMTAIIIFVITISLVLILLAVIWWRRRQYYLLQYSKYSQEENHELQEKEWQSLCAQSEKESF